MTQNDIPQARCPQCGLPFNDADGVWRVIPDGSEAHTFTTVSGAVRLVPAAVLICRQCARSGEAA